MTIAQQIKFLKAAFGKIERMDPESANYAKLCKILDRASNDALIAAMDAKIKFVSPLARNRLICRNIAV